MTYAGVTGKFKMTNIFDYINKKIAIWEILLKTVWRMIIAIGGPLREPSVRMK